VTVKYKVEPERVFLGDADPKKRSERAQARTTCASAVGKFAWLRIDVCATQRGPAVTKKDKVTTSVDAVDICREFAARYMNLQEFFGVLCLDARQQPIGFAVVSVGGASFAAVDTKIVFKPVLLSTAAAMIVTHNHPSGEASPSPEDVTLTQRIASGARILGVQLLDHIVVAEKGHFSFLDSGLMPRG
jgi:DNA repair protein RadC